MTGTLILPEWLIDVPGAPPKQGWGVRVVGDVVDAVAPNNELRRLHRADDVWEAPEQALAPGFVDRVDLLLQAPRAGCIPDNRHDLDDLPLGRDHRRCNQFQELLIFNIQCVAF